MESVRKKQTKVKYFDAGFADRKKEKEINEFLLQNQSINVKGIASDWRGKLILLYEE